MTDNGPATDILLEPTEIPVSTGDVPEARPILISDTLAPGTVDPAAEWLNGVTQATAFHLGALAVVFFAGAWLFLLYSLRQVLAGPLQLGGILASLALGQAVALLLTRRANPRVRELLLFACSLVLAFGLALLSESSPGSDSRLARPDRLLILGLLPLSLAADSALVYLVFGAALFTCGFVEMDSLGATIEWMSPFHLLVLGVIPGFVWGYRRQSAVVVGANAVLLAAWLLGAPLTLRDQSYMLVASLCVGAAFLSVAEAHPPGSAMAECWRLTGLLFAGSPLFFLGMAEIWPQLNGVRNLESRIVREAFATASLFTAVLVFWRLLRMRRQEEQPPREALAALARQLWFPACLTAAATGLTVWSCSDWLDLALLPTIAANFTTLLLGAYMIDTGVRKKQVHYVFGGVFCAGRALWLTCARNNIDDEALLIAGILSGFGLALGILAFAWLRLEPARPDPLPLPAPAWRSPAWFERVLGFFAARPTLTLLVAFAVQHAALMLVYATAGDPALGVYDNGVGDATAVRPVGRLGGRDQSPAAYGRSFGGVV